MLLSEKKDGQRPLSETVPVRLVIVRLPHSTWGYQPLSERVKAGEEDHRSARTLTELICDAFGSKRPTGV